MQESTVEFMETSQAPFLLQKANLIRKNLGQKHVDKSFNTLLNLDVYLDSLTHKRQARLVDKYS